MVIVPLPKRKKSEPATPQFDDVVMNVEIPTSRGSSTRRPNSVHRFPSLWGDDGDDDSVRDDAYAFSAREEGAYSRKSWSDNRDNKDDVARRLTFPDAYT